MRLGRCCIVGATLALIGIFSRARRSRDGDDVSRIRERAGIRRGGGWHTEIDLPRAAVEGRLAGLMPAWARYVVFGWGARDYYMARDPGLADLLRAAAPGPAVVLVMPLLTSPAGFAGAGNVRAVAASHDRLRQLSQFLWEASPRMRPACRVGSAPGPIHKACFMRRPALTTSPTPATPGRPRLCVLQARRSARRASSLPGSSSTSWEDDKRRPPP